ncbi:MAG: hypothetical protein OSA89_05955 [Mariniblastus sp.]|nr:hypothetical protein [Mariniblastus sp.]
MKNQPTFVISRHGYSFLIICVAILMTASFTGCKLGIKEASMLTYRDTVWSKRAFNLRYGDCKRAYANHFENGFCAGYTDMCNGGDGYVPALPPEEYRAPEYQSADGAKCVNSWFEGYPAGVAAAKKDKSGTYHDVLISRMINSAIDQSNTDPILPVDVQVVSKDAIQALPVNSRDLMGTMPPSSLPADVRAVTSTSAANSSGNQATDIGTQVEYPLYKTSTDFSTSAKPVVLPTSK